MVAWALAACGDVENKQPDANTLPAPDAARICDPAGTFDAPTPLVGFNTAAQEGTARFTADELELYLGYLGTASASDYDTL
jgi:hypothetical protein